VHGERAISADTALRLGKYFGVSPEFWLNLQTHYDLEIETDIFEKKSEFGKIIPCKHRIKSIPLRPMKSLKGVLKGISTSIKREKDRL